MTTSALAPQGDRPVVQGNVVQPSAIAGRVESAAFALGQLLKDLIHGSHNAFASENAVLNALQTVDNFIAASVRNSSLPALADGNQRAGVEDVSKRVAPNGQLYSAPSNVPAIDYDKLAMAMVRAQQQINAENANHPPVSVVTDAPAPAHNTEATYDEPATY